MTTLPAIAALIRAAVCPECDGSGAYMTRPEHTEYVSRSMAHDAGDPRLEGAVYQTYEAECQQCSWCAERGEILKDIEDPSTTPASLIPSNS